MEQFPHGGGWYNYTLGHGVSGPNGTRDSCEWLSHCLRLIVGKLHEKPPQLDPAFLSSTGRVFSPSADCSLQSWAGARSWGKRLFKARLQTTLRGAWFSKRWWWLSGHRLVKYNSLSLALAEAGVLYKKVRFQDNLITCISCACLLMIVFLLCL